MKGKKEREKKKKREREKRFLTLGHSHKHEGTHDTFSSAAENRQHWVPKTTSRYAVNETVHLTKLLIMGWRDGGFRWINGRSEQREHNNRIFRWFLPSPPLPQTPL